MVAESFFSIIWPDCVVQRSANVSVAGVVESVVTRFEPSLPCPSKKTLFTKTWHGESLFMPIDDHEAVMEFPREIVFGWTMMVAIGGLFVALTFGVAGLPRIALMSCCATEG